MSLALGNATRVAFAEQVTWGTAVARTKGLRIVEDGPALSQSMLQKTVLGHASNHLMVPSKRAVGGPLKLYLPPNGGELLLKHAFGSIGTVKGTLDDASNYYTHTFSLARALPAPGLSVEVDRDGASAGKAYLYDSCLVNKLTLEQKLEDGLMMSLDLMGRDEEAVDPTGALTYQSLKTFDWDELAITIGGVAFDCDEFSFDLDNVLDGDRHKFGTRLRRDISRKDIRKLTGKVKGEFDSVTAYNHFRNLDEVALVATWTGRLLGEDTIVKVYEKMTLTLPRITFTGETPPAKGPGRIELNLPFQCSATLDTDNSEASLVLINTTE